MSEKLACRAKDPKACRVHGKKTSSATNFVSMVAAANVADIFADRSTPAKDADGEDAVALYYDLIQQRAEKFLAPVKTITDLKTAAYDTLFAVAPTYQKTARVQARQVTEPTPVTTILADGTVETQNTAQRGDYIITNPGGERYIISAEKFAKRYRATYEAGTFQAVGEIVAIKNPTGKPITINAPWGEEQYGDENCIIASQVDTPGDRYIIGAAEFIDTYALKAG